MILYIKRAYEPPQTEDGYRILVDRIWPRGLTKEKLKIDLWIKEAAPSTALRKWFNHDISRWDQFVIQYEKELNENTGIIHHLQQLMHDHEKVTLIYAAKDQEHNQAVILQNFLKRMPL